MLPRKHSKCHSGKVREKKSADGGRSLLVALYAVLCPSRRRVALYLSTGLSLYLCVALKGRIVHRSVIETNAVNANFLVVAERPACRLIIPSSRRSFNASIPSFGRAENEQNITSISTECNRIKMRGALSDDSQIRAPHHPGEGQNDANATEG